MAITEKSSGKIIRRRPYDIPEPIETDAGGDSDADSDDGYQYLDVNDPDLYVNPDSLTPELFRAKVQAAKAEAEAKALRETLARNGNGDAHNPTFEKMIAQFMEKSMNADPLADFEKFQRIRSMFERKDNPAPPPPPALAPEPMDPKIAALSLVLENDEVMEKIDRGISRLIGSKDNESSWVDFGMAAVEMLKRAIDTGQLAATAREIAGAIASARQSQTQAWPQQQMVWGEAPGAQMRRGPPPGRPPEASAPAQGPAPPPESSPPPQASAPPIRPQAQAPQLSPADELVIGLTALLDKGAPVSEAKKLVDVAIFKYPELGNSVDELLNYSTEQIINVLSSYHPPIAQMGARAKEWIDNLINSFEDGHETFPEEINNKGAKL
ncbi:MAG: hypothetical protein J2P41_00745 [Blastocatellia bacterium]|nr:hypothetical protein [Blastocatellia bacterium]